MQKQTQKQTNAHSLEEDLKDIFLAIKRNKRARKQERKEEEEDGGTTLE